MNQENTKEKLLKIGELAKQTGELPSTVRFWTSLGLLTPKRYSPTGYAYYHPTMVAKIKTIRELQSEKRLTLPEIKDWFDKSELQLSEIRKVRK